MSLQSSPPSLTPQVFDSVMINGVMQPESPNSIAGPNGSFPRVAGQLTVTVTGSVSTGDQLALTVTNNALAGNPITVTYTTLASDSVTNIAQGLAALLTSNASLQAVDIFATSYKGVVTFNQLGPVSLFTTVTGTVVIGSETLTINNSGVPVGGSGAIVPINNKTFALGTSVVSLRAGLPQELPFTQVQALVAAGARIK